MLGHTMRKVVFGLLLLASESGAHPCDAEGAAACPFDGGKALGACLKDKSQHEVVTELSSDCEAFLKLHDVCAENLASGTCTGTHYTDDAMLCLGQWMKRTELTAECAALVPEIVVKERVLDDAAIKKRDKRKRAREKAAAQVRKLNEENAEADAPKSSKKKKTSKKSRSVDIDDTDL